MQHERLLILKIPAAESAHSSFITFYKLCFLASDVKAIKKMEALKSPLLILKLSPKSLMILLGTNHSIS